MCYHSQMSDFPGDAPSDILKKTEADFAEVFATPPVDETPKEKLRCIFCGAQVTKDTMWLHPVGVLGLCVGPVFMREEHAPDDGDWKLDTCNAMYSDTRKPHEDDEEDEDPS